MKEYILDQGSIDELVKDVSTLLPVGGVIILQGDLAAGKTRFVATFAKAFGIKEAVTSPTFSLQQCYGENIFHYDIYNHGIEHFLALGLLEELEREGYHFVEWGDETLENILANAEIPFLVIEIEKLQDKRLYRVDDAHAKS